MEQLPHVNRLFTSCIERLSLHREIDFMDMLTAISNGCNTSMLAKVERIVMVAKSE